MPKLLLPIAAVVAVGAATAGGATYLLTRDEAVEEVPPPAVQTTATPAPAATETPAAPTPTPTPAPEPTPTPSPDATYQDVEHGFSVHHPAEWSASEALPDAQVSDLLKEVEFVGKGGLPRASVFVYQNPAFLPLEDWITEHDSIFFDRPPQEITVDGARALLAPLNFAG